MRALYALLILAVAVLLYLMFSSCSRRNEPLEPAEQFGQAECDSLGWDWNEEAQICVEPHRIEQTGAWQMLQNGERQQEINELMNRR